MNVNSEQFEKTNAEFELAIAECRALFEKKLHDYRASWRILRPTEHGYADTVDMSNDEAMALYDRYAHEALELMKRKNHDYDEAWRSMRVSSYTDLILTKIERIKEMEDLNGQTLVSEGIDANYMDIVNYAVFGMIKLGSKA